MMVSGGARVAGVMGWPVHHSLSPRMHGFWLDQHAIDGAFIPFAVAPANLCDALRALPMLGIAGVSVTVPHKERVCDLVDELDPWARRVGAVNTVTVRDDGTLAGSNSDGFGFLENLRASQPDWRAATGPAVVIGAGGAARAIVAALADAGAPEICVVNRTIARAEALAVDLADDCIAVHPWEARSRVLERAALLVNATVLGMNDAPPLELPLDALPPAALVCDIVYAPLKTPLLAAAEARGNPTADGLGMLLHQGRPAFAAWFGVEPKVTPGLRAFVLGGRG